jgi:ribonuclease VapC
MIAVDTSALLATLLEEPEGPSCIRALEAEPELLISAGTLAEALIVANRRGIGEGIRKLLSGLPFQIAPVTPAEARRVADAYRRWGKGFHEAKLNFGDCFAYALAKERNCPLLYVGNDFSQTDIVSALT